jgi:hypothetical protein
MAGTASKLRGSCHKWASALATSAWLGCHGAEAAQRPEPGLAPGSCGIVKQLPFSGSAHELGTAIGRGTEETAHTVSLDGLRAVYAPATSRSTTRMRS